MGTLRRRRYRRPILGRLAWAWLAFGGVSIVFAGLVLFIGDHWPGRIELAVVGEAERLAPPTGRNNDVEPAAKPATPVTPASAADLRDGGETPPEDVFAQSYEFYPPDKRDASENPATAQDTQGELVITVDGKTVDGHSSAGATKRKSSSRLTSLIPDPDPTLLRKTRYGLAPRIGPNGRKPYEAYARPFDPAKDRPIVAIVVGGLGLNDALTERAIEDLPPEVTLAFAPYAKDLDAWAARARHAGHEVAIELPMEGYSSDPAALGTAALLSSRTTEQNLQRLDWILSRFPGYFAATNYQGGKFSAKPDAIKPVLEALRDHGVAYIDDTGAAQRAAGETGGELGVVNRIVASAGDNQSRTMLREDLEALERIARSDGDALGKTYAYAANLEEIESWAKDIESRGLTLAPASAVLRERGGAG